MRTLICSLLRLLCRLAGCNQPPDDKPNKITLHGRGTWTADDILKREG